MVGGEVGTGVGDEVVGEDALHPLEGFVELIARVGGGMLAGDLGEAAGEDVDVGGGVGDGEQAGFYAVVEVGGEVCDFVGEVDDLGFERWRLREEVGSELGVRGFGVVAAVLDDAFADREGEVEAAVGGVTLLEVLDYAQGVEIVVEAKAVALEALVEGAFAGVAEGVGGLCRGRGPGFRPDLRRDRGRRLRLGRSGLLRWCG